MGIFSNKHSFAKWINHPVHFLFWVAAGFSFWTMNFKENKVDLTTVQLSSFSENLAEVRKAEHVTISRLPASAVEIKKSNRKALPKKFQNNPAFMLFGKIEEFID